MGIIKRGILGGFSGKVGNIVGTSWKGRAVIKAMPLSVANPKTTKQVNQRGAMTNCVVAAKEFLGNAIPAICSPFAGDISGYNLFVKRTIKAFDVAGNFTAEKFKISEGSLGNYLNGSVTYDVSDSEVMFSLSNREHSDYNVETDLVFIVLWNNTQKKGAMVSKTVATSFVDEKVKIDAGFAEVGDDVSAVVCTKRLDNSRQSGTTSFLVNIQA